MPQRRSKHAPLRVAVELRKWSGDQRRTGGDPCRTRPQPARVDILLTICSRIPERSKEELWRASGALVARPEKHGKTRCFSRFSTRRPHVGAGIEGAQGFAYYTLLLSGSS